MGAAQLSWADELDLLTRFHPGNAAFSVLGMMVEVGKDDSQADRKEESIEVGGEDYKSAHNTNKQTNMKNIGRGRKISHYQKDDDCFIAQQIEMTLGSGHRAESIFNSSQTSTKTGKSLEKISTPQKSSSCSSPIQKKNALFPGESGQSSGQENRQGGGLCHQTPVPVVGGLAGQGESCPPPEHEPIVIRAKLIKKQNSTGGGSDEEASIMKELETLGIGRGRGKSSFTDAQLAVGATKNDENKQSSHFQKARNNNNNNSNIDYFPTFDYDGYNKMTKASHWWPGNTTSGRGEKQCQPLCGQKLDNKRDDLAKGIPVDESI